MHGVRWWLAGWQGTSSLPPSGAAWSGPVQVQYCARSWHGPRRRFRDKVRTSSKLAGLALFCGSAPSAHCTVYPGRKDHACMPCMARSSEQSQRFTRAGQGRASMREQEGSLDRCRCRCRSKCAAGLGLRLPVPVPVPDGWLPSPPRQQPAPPAGAASVKRGLRSSRST